MNPFQVYSPWQMLIVVAVLGCSYITAATDTAGGKLTVALPSNITKATIDVKYGTKIIPKQRDSGDDNFLQINNVQNTRSNNLTKQQNNKTPDITSAGRNLTNVNKKSKGVRNPNRSGKSNSVAVTRTSSLRGISSTTSSASENDIPIVHKITTAKSRTTPTSASPSSTTRGATIVSTPKSSTAVQRISQTTSSHRLSNNSTNNRGLITTSNGSIVSHSDRDLQAVAVAANSPAESPHAKSSQRQRSHPRNDVAVARNAKSNTTSSSKAISKANGSAASTSVTQLQPLEQHSLSSSSFGARTKQVQTTKARNGHNNRIPVDKRIPSSTNSAKMKKPTAKSTNKAPFRPDLSFPNPFNTFITEFWQHFNPPHTIAAAAVKKPPKKYNAVATSIIFPSSTPTTPTTPTMKPNKLTERKVVEHTELLPSSSTTIKPSTSNSFGSRTNSIEHSEGPFRIALPTVSKLSHNPSKLASNDTDKGKRNIENNLRDKFNCPRESEVRFQLFPKICQIDEDCKVWNREEICCEIFGAKSCVSGIQKPLPETSHSRIIRRKCPNRPLAELWWDLTECESDKDCWPRVCCPDGRKRYCRTSQPELNTVVVPVPVQRSYSYLSEYLRCTPPPPAIFDLHPKVCKSTLDCFPNVCCQEAGLRHCRPPQKSILTMLANVLNVDFVKRLTQNLVIK